ncbi:MAG: glycosyltransferase family 4 protein [Gemmatimonadota bacterium]
MRILVVNWQDWTHPRAGGAEFHLREVFGRLARRSHRVDLLCTRFDGAPAAESMEGINVIRRGGAYELFNYAVPRAWRVLRKNGYDVVVDDLNKVPFYSPLFVDRPVVALVHHLFGATIFEETNPLFGAYLWLSERPVARVYGKSPFIAVSDSTADDLTARGIPRGRITVIPNGLPVLDWERYLSIPKDEEPLFVYLGRIKRYKRLELALEAFVRIVAQYPDARLVIAGDGDHRPALEHQVERLGLDGRVQFPGWLDDDAKWRLLRRAWALLYTSPKEGWGVSSLEAQRVGTIAIVSDVPGLRDTVIDGETGRIVPHADVTALARVMGEAISHPDQRRAMEGRAARRAAGFSWERAADDTLEVLEAAAAGGAGA